MSFSLNHLSASEFEELCFDLLADLGWVNLTWRKGTGADASPADQGRDIEGSRQIETPVGDVFEERWFIECKHHVEGVPATALDGVLTSAQRERPDHVLVVVSNFLSNPAKEHIAAYEESNKPPFKIHVWERPELEKLLESRSRLRQKYDLGLTPEIVARLHPTHVAYIQKPPTNTLDYLFDILDDVDPRKRLEILGWVSVSVVSPRFRRPRHRRETLAEMMVDPVDYAALKKKCYSLETGEVFLAHALVAFTLDTLFSTGDVTALDEPIEYHRSMIRYAERELAKGSEHELELENIIKMSKELIVELPNEIPRRYALYEYFCEKVVARLFDEQVQLPRSVDDLPFVD